MKYVQFGMREVMTLDERLQWLSAWKVAKELAQMKPEPCPICSTSLGADIDCAVCDGRTWLLEQREKARIKRMDMGGVRVPKRLLWVVWLALLGTIFGLILCMAETH